ncbi:P-loop NTPase [Halodesulfurarchaeum sp.]|uniref:P-loop NTPase n=1 Tax=Halodesulfurarchaeum sp. TaxID=1980530 RepID=UPI002FC34CDB
MADTELSRTVEIILEELEQPQFEGNVFEENIVHGIRNEDGTIAVEADIERLDPNGESGFSETLLDKIRAVDGVSSAYIEPSLKTDNRIQTSEIETIIAVASTKGGVGKSTVATRIAAGLAAEEDVSLFDADIYGPNVPELLSVEGPVRADENNRPIPISKDGMEIMSVGFLTEGGPLAWRGAMAHDALSDLFEDIAWERPDTLVVDLPPGTSDVVLTTIQEIPIDGVVLVTTPFQTSVADTKRTLELFHDDDIPVLGAVVNMAQFECPTCGDKHPLFDDDTSIDALNVPVLAELPFDRDLQTMPSIGSVSPRFEPVIDQVRERLRAVEVPDFPDEALDVRGDTVEERKRRVATVFTALESGEPFVMLSDRDPSPVKGYLVELLDERDTEAVFDTFQVYRHGPDTWVLETEHP